MQLKFFNVPLFSETDEDAINRFLRSVRVLEIKRELIVLKESAYWAICVTYLPGLNNESGQTQAKGKVDYKNVLSETEFKKFCLLRKIRKQLAESDAVPAFAVFTDAELADISRLEVVSISGLKSVNGIGEKKIEKYGDRFCEMIVSLEGNEESG